MESKKKKYYSALKISVIYLIFSSLYIFLSDKIILNFMGDSASVNTLNNIQTHKGLIFVLITSILIFGFIQREINSKRKYILDLESKKKNLEYSEIKFRTLFESMALGVIYQNRDGEITNANKAAQKILGLTLDQMQGKTSFDPDWKSIREDGTDFSGNEHPSTQALKTGKVINNVVMGVFNTIKKEYRWIKIDSVPQFKNGETNPFQVFTTFDDVTERKEAEQKLKESEEKFFKIFQSSPNAILLSRLSDYKILNVNASIHTITGYTSEDLIGKKHSQFNIWKSEDDREFFTDQMVKNGSVKDFEAEFIHKSGEIRIWRTSGEVIEIRGEKFVLGIISDITELRVAEIELKESEKKFRTLIENSQVGIFLDDKNGNASYINERCADIVGLPLDKALDLDWVPSIHPDDRETVAFKWANAIKNGIPFKEEYRWVHSDGKIVWSQGAIEPVFDDNGNVTLFIGTLIDITERKHAETATKKQTYLLTKAQEIGNIGTWEFDIKKNVLTWTQQNYRIFGVDEETPLTYELFLTTIYQEDRDFVDKAWTEGVKSNNYDIEHRIIVNDEVRWVREKAQFSYDDSGQPIKAIGLTQDITSYKALTKELKDNEEKFSKIFSSSPNSIMLTRLSNFEIVNANEATLHITGYALSDIIGKTQSEFDVWKSADERILFGQQLIKNGKVKDFEAEFVTKSGEDRIWKTSGEIVQINNEKYILGIIEDITDFKKANYDLIRQAEFINTMTDNQPSGIVACDANGELVLFNKAAKDWHGVDVMEVPQDKWAENYGLYKKDGEVMLDKMEIPLIKAFSGEAVENLEIIIKAKNQKLRSVLCNGASFYDSIGKKLGAVIVMNDITELKTIENSLKRSEAKLRSAFSEVERSEFLLNEAGRIAKIGAWEFDLATQKTRWSDQVFELYAIPVGEVPDFDFIMGCYIEGSEEILRKSVEECIAERKIYELELRLLNARNEKLWVRAIGYPIINDKDEIISIRGIVQDITEQKKKENELKFSEERFRGMIEGAPDPIFIQTNMCFAYLNKHAVNLFGAKDDKELIGKPVLDFFHPDFHKAALERIKKLNVDKTLVQEPFEQILIKLNGKEVWVETKGEPLVFNNENGGLVFVRDISYRKNAEKELQDSKNKLTELLNSLESGVVVHAPDTSITYHNQRAAKILRARYDELTGKQVFDYPWNFLHEDGSILSLEEYPISQILTRKEGIQNMVIGMTHSEDTVWALLNGFPILNEKNEIIEVVISFIEITEQVVANTKIKESEAKYKLLAENITDVISLHGHDAKYEYVSPSIRSVRGYEPEELLGKSPYDFIHSDDIEEATSDVHVKRLEKGLSTKIVYRFKYKDGHYGWLESNRQPILDKNNNILKIVSSSRDITDRIAKEKAIENYQKSLQNMTTEISLIEEKQRKEIAENIHDHLSQSLVISKIKLTDLQKEVKNSNSKKELNQVIKHITDALENSRKITYDLSPPILYELGIVETLYWMTEKIEEDYNLKALFSTEINYIDLPESKLILLYRIIQELVNNIIKHANAKKIDITLTKENKGIQIILSDDGKGFDINNLNETREKNTGFGLFTVRERVKKLSGNFTISSKKGVGTDILISLPLKNN